ncbi:MAG: TIGR02281 family clan AA aspartic protease [Amaricoccus sp.]|uniref:retropepsin-like aspartic protease family protein n=1 Tax=Amaricoccus sp. TaxID=1872485 RepID=UPI0039E4CB5C
MTWDPDTTMRVLYLVCLLVFVAGGLFWRGRNLGRRMRDLLVWVLIFALAVIVYGFRDALTRELMPAEMAVSDSGAIELRRASDGHFHARMEVNGVPVRFMVDTGASEIVLSRKDAERVGIDVDALQFLGRAQTANGTVATATVRLGEVKLGGLSETGMRASVSAGGLDTSLLGMAGLDRFAKVEIVGDVMRLVP